jgi:nucleoside-diphosphate-sugar epimerase
MIPIVFASSQRTFRSHETVNLFNKIDNNVNQLPLFLTLNNCHVLITGGTGFIGRYLITELLRQGAKVRILSRSTPATWAKEIEWVQGDLTVPNTVIGACSDIDLVFHLASSAHIFETNDKTNTSHFQITEQGTDVLLQEMKRANVKRMIFISSVKAMGEGCDRCLDETSPTQPTSNYGRAKLHAEQLVLETGQRNNLHVTILRLPMVYGIGNKGNLPRMIHAIRVGIFPPLPQINNRRSMIHVKDVVQAMLLAATGCQTSGRIYIVTDGEVYSTTDIERLIRTQLGKTTPNFTVSIRLLNLVAKLGDKFWTLGINFPITSEKLNKLVGSACYSHALIQQELKFKPKFTIQNSIMELVND